MAKKNKTQRTRTKKPKKSRGRRKTARPESTATAAEPRLPRFAVVGIGASAGGLDAFKKFFHAMAADSGMAFVLVQHLDPTHESMMVDLLTKYTAMKVVQVTDRMPVEPNCVYMIPPNKYLSMCDGVLHLSEPIKRRGMRMPIDFFFRSLAEDQKEKAICVILSGTGTDGTLGMKDVKSAGGMAMVQDPKTAQYDGMPQSAIATGVVDVVLPVEQMPEALVKYVGYANMHEAGRKPVIETTPDDLNAILAVLHTRTKHDFRCYKDATLTRRVHRRMGLKQVGGYADYVNLLREDPGEAKALYKDLLIGVTAFFRDSESWRDLQEVVIPEIVRGKGPDNPLRVWVPGCATGEEAYSIAMLLAAHASKTDTNFDVQIFASDIDQEALERARAGVYPDSIAGDVSPERLKRFFVSEEQSYCVGKQLRESVVFAVQNLITDPPFSKLDLICCRNLLIYLQADVQQKVLSLFHFALNETGYLFLGPSETIGAQTDMFEPVSKKWRIFRRIGPTQAARVDFPIVYSDEDRGVEPVFGPAAKPRRGRLGDLAQQALLSEYAPPAVLINRKYEILYFCGATSQFLDLPAGEPTSDLMVMARDGLRTKLRALIHRAVRDDETVSVAARVKRDGKYHPVNLTARPLHAPKSAEGLVLVTFKETGNDRLEAADAEGGDGWARARQAAVAEDEDAFVKQLEYELNITKEDLQSTIEELETSNEELKASNEEVMSMNEELQSSNEELETSKEELQSLNEELNTVNNQLQEKVAELESTNNDMTNLFNSTDIATVFLDRDFCVKRFTPATTKLFRLIATDTGRPIRDIARNFADDTLLNDADRVLHELTPVEKEIRTDDGGCHLCRIVPYRTSDDRIDGIVLTFVDITVRKKGEVEIRELNERLEHRVAERTERIKLLAEAIANLGEGVLITDDELEWPGPRIAFVNEAMCRITGYAAEELIGQTPRILQGDATDREALERLKTELSAGRSCLVELINHRKDGTTYDAEVFITPLFNAEGQRTNFVSIHRDISTRKHSEQALRSSEERLRAVLDAAADAIITIDRRGIIAAANRATEQMFGYAEDELIGRNVSILMPAPYCDEHDGYIARYLETGEARIIGAGREVVARRKGGGTFPVGLAVSDVDHLGLFTGIIRDISALKELQKEVLEIAAEEDRRIGHELHEGIQQEVTALELFAGTMRDALETAEQKEVGGRESRLLAEVEFQKIRNSANKLCTGLNETHKHVQELSRGVLPVQIDAQGLNAALTELASSTDAVQDVTCRFASAEVVTVANNSTATHLYRIAQEAVNNALRHSGGNEIQLSLTGQDDHITLEVSDNGVGIDPAFGSRAGVPEDKRGIGLRAMYYRAGLIGATLQIERREMGGTRVRCTVARGGRPR